MTNTAMLLLPPGYADDNPNDNSAMDVDLVIGSLLTGTVFLDGDGNGSMGRGEGVAGATVVITTSVGTTLTVTTDAFGHFSARPARRNGGGC
ncbi:MAG: hypothetical protein R2867_16315 [Caldilineaceae bacterium]